MSLSELKSISSGIKTQTDPLSLKAIVIYKKKKVVMADGEKFFIAGAYRQYLSEAPFFRGTEFILPDSVAEEVISELGIPVGIRAEKNGTKTEIREAVALETKPRRGANFSFIVIDPGHGGKDPGAPGPKGLQEKEIVLMFSVTLANVLKKKFPDKKIYLTRGDDRFLELGERSRLANKLMKGDDWGVFISIHGNASLSPKSHGFEVYYLSLNPENEESRRVMLRENQSSGSAEVRSIESWMLNARIQTESKMLARLMNSRLSSRLEGLVSSRGIKRADFAVLRGSLMPAILVEVGYLTNPREASLMTGWKYRSRFALGIAEALEEFSVKVENE